MKMDVNKNLSTQRIVWIDWAKTILIASVCVGHFSPPEIQKLLIWGCHMPAFFFISGYLYKRHKAWQTIISFVIPVVFYSSIIFGVHIIKDIVKIGYWDYMLDFYHPWYRMFGQFFIRIHNNPYGDIPIMGIWFVIALLTCRLLSGDIKKFTFVLRYRYVVLIVLLIWLTIEPIIWDYIPLKDVKFYYGIYALPFFLLGYIIKDLDVRIERLHFISILIVAFAYCSITLNLQRFEMLHYQCGPTYMVFFVCAMFGSLVLFWICTKLPRLKIVEVFSIGTLLILLLHKELDFFIRPVFHLMGLTPTTTYIGASLLPWFEVVLEFIIFYYPILWLNSHFPILLGKVPKR